MNNYQIANPINNRTWSYVWTQVWNSVRRSLINIVDTNNILLDDDIDDGIDTVRESIGMSVTKSVDHHIWETINEMNKNE